jgi:hypothetical protein
MFNLGLYYLNGRGVRRDLRVSFRWFLRAAQAHSQDAYVHVAYCLHEGEVVRRNVRESMLWYRRSSVAATQRGYFGYCDGERTPPRWSFVRSSKRDCGGCWRSLPVYVAFRPTRAPFRTLPAAALARRAWQAARPEVAAVAQFVAMEMTTERVLAPGAPSPILLPGPTNASHAIPPSSAAAAAKAAATSVLVGLTTANINVRAGRTRRSPATASAIPRVVPAALGKNATSMVVSKSIGRAPEIAAYACRISG